MLRRSSICFGSVALSGLMAENSFAGLSASHGMPRPHFRPRAKNVIFCYMSGGVSHLDSFDPKPLLAKKAGEPMPVPVHKTMFDNNGNIFPSPWEFKRYGECGMPVSDIFSHMGSCADDLAVIRSMTSSVNEHAQGNYFFHTGFPFLGHPSAGAWASYGLGTENQDLPGFIVLQSGGAIAPHGGVGVFSNGFLPAQHQASIIQADGTPALLNVSPSESDQLQRSRLNFVRGIDEGYLEGLGRDEEVEAAVRNYETAYRMQSVIPELCDLKGESAATRKLYGMDSPDAQKAAYAKQCLLARRLVEKGVRFGGAELYLEKDRRRGSGESLGSTQQIEGGTWRNGLPGRSAHRGTLEGSEGQGTAG